MVQANKWQIQMNMEKVNQSQNVLRFSWYNKNIYFFPT